MKKLKTDELQRKSVDEFREADKMKVSVLLDDVRSMMNVGSIFRTGDAFMIEKIYLCGITGQPPHREIQKTALGATETVSWEYHSEATPLVRRLKEEGVKIIGVEQTSASLQLQQYDADQATHYLLILGNEVNGISEQLLPLLDESLEIPQHGFKHSLNVSVAAGIVLYKFFERLRLS